MISYIGAALPVRNREGLFVLIISSVLLFQGPSIVAQEFHLGCQWGKGAYDMGHLKSFERHLVSLVPGVKQKVADYPPYWFYQPTFSVNWNRVSLGMALGIHNTGSRHSLIDYSGEYRFDTRIKGTSFGVLAQLKLNPRHRVQFSFFTESGIIASKVNMKEYFVVDEHELIDESVTSLATNLYLEPGVQLSCPVSFIIVAVQAGYCMPFGGNGLHGYYNGQDFEFEDYLGPVKPDWGGYRISASLSLNLNRLFNGNTQK